MLRRLLLILFVSLGLFCTACADEEVTDDPGSPPAGLDGVTLNDAYGSKTDDTRPIVVEYLGDRSLSNTADYEEIDRTPLNVAVESTPSEITVLTHDISVYEPVTEAAFRIDTAGWKMIMIQGLQGEVGNLNLGPEQMVECRVGENIIECPGFSTSRFDEIVLDVATSTATVVTTTDGITITGNIPFKAGRMDNFFHILPVPTSLTDQNTEIAFRACNFVDCLE